MSTHEETRKEKICLLYNISGISADVNQMGRAYIRGETKGATKNISQIISKLEKIRKRI